MNIGEKLEALMQNEDFAAAAGAAKDAEEFRGLLAANGIELSEGELQEMLMAVYADNSAGELDETQLEGVAGGGYLKDIWKGFKLGWKIGSKFYDWEKKLYKKLGID